MTNKQLHRLKRVELLDMLIEQGKLVEAQNEELAKLRTQVEDLQKQLADHRLSLEQAGNLAEASLKIAQVFEAAQKAAGIYLENLREKSGSAVSVDAAMEQAKT